MNAVSPDCTSDGDGIDSRVKEELETLNFASSEINKLETEIDKAREKFRRLLSDSTTRLNALYKKLGKCVGKARPYFELLKKSKEAEDDLTKATVAYQRANSTYRAAKETVALAEERMTSENETNRPEFDSAWQEMMNHATMRFVESEKEKRASEDFHQKCAAEFTSVQQKLRSMQKDIPRSINRAKPYFDLKDQLEARLQMERQSVEDLQMALTAAKDTYRESLVTLEAISEEIHRQRKMEILPPRTPGVGAEASLVEQTDLLTINLDAQSTASDIFPDESDVASLCSQDVASLLDSPSELQPQVLLGQTDELLDRERSSTTSSSEETTAKPISSGEVTSANKVSELSSSKLQNETAKVKTECSTEVNAHSSIFPNHSEKALDKPISPGESLLATGPKSSLQVESPDSRSVDENGKLTPNSHTKPRGRPKDKRVQKLNPSHFPILQGLTETNKRMSPKLPHGRPRGQEMQSHHSPSPVRRAGTEYFEFLEPKLRSKAAIAREVSPGPNLFPDSDTSLFEKNSKHSKENTKAHVKMMAGDKTSAQTGSDVNDQGETKGKNKERSNAGRIDLETRSSTGRSQNDVENTSTGGDGVTEDGKVFYHL